MIPDAGKRTDTLLNEREGTPWRYVCPECGSTAVKARRKVTPDGLTGRDASERYYCDSHAGSIPVVYDKRRGIEVRP